MYFRSWKLVPWQKHQIYREPFDHDEVHERILPIIHRNRSTSQRSEKSTRKINNNIEQISCKKKQV